MPVSTLLSRCIQATLLVAMTVEVTGDIYTSTFKIENLVKHENVILDIVKAQMEVKKRELREVENFYTDRLQAYNDNRDFIKKFRADHPNTQYNTLKEFLHRYTHLIGNNQTLDQNSKEQQSSTISLPTNDDLSGGRLSLLNLQAVYNLNPYDMVKGNYSGYQGPPLHFEDAFQIGRDAFIDGTFSHSIEWLKAALEAHGTMTENKQLFTFNTSSTSLSRTEIKALLGRAHLYNGNRRTAIQLYEEIRKVKNINDIPDLTELEKELASEEDFAATSQTTESDYGKERHEHVCTLEQSTNTFNVIDSRLVCRYQSGYVPYYRFKEELLSVSPFVSVFYNFSTDDEADKIMQKAEPWLERALVGVYEDNPEESEMRTGDSAWIPDSAMKTVDLLSDRIEQVTKLKVKNRTEGIKALNYESLQVTNYGIGGKFDQHMDGSYDKYDQQESGEDTKPFRYDLATFIIYLTDVYVGGATVFPYIKVTVPPRTNMALFWYNYTPSLNVDGKTIHLGCPVVIGQKWIATKWISPRGNEFNRRCGLHEDDTQLDIEPFMDHKSLRIF